METEPVRRQQTTLPHVIAIGGGVPIKVGNDVIGGVGLSGSPESTRPTRMPWRCAAGKRRRWSTPGYAGDA